MTPRTFGASDTPTAHTASSVGARLSSAGIVSEYRSGVGSVMVGSSVFYSIT
jgi:hypothetical protein